MSEHRNGHSQELITIQTQISATMSKLHSASKSRLQHWQAYKTCIEECTCLQQELITLESKLFAIQDKIQVIKARSESKPPSKSLSISPASTAALNKAIESLSEEARDSLIQSLLKNSPTTSPPAAE